MAIIVEKRAQQRSTVVIAWSYQDKVSIVDDDNGLFSGVIQVGRELLQPGGEALTQLERVARQLTTTSTSTTVHQLERIYVCMRVYVLPGTRGVRISS